MAVNWIALKTSYFNMFPECRIKKQGSTTKSRSPGASGYTVGYRSTIDSLISSELPRNSGAYMAAAVVGRAL